MADTKLLQKYAVRQHEELIYASSDADKVSHMDGAGDLDTGRAWKAIRRPSDMVFKQFTSYMHFVLTRWQNEYSKQIKELRALDKPGKTYGKVFVKGMSILQVLLKCMELTSVISLGSEEPDRSNTA